jgi:hypothetical protein
MRIETRMAAGLALAYAMALPARAQLKWEGCADLTGSQLRKTLLISRTAAGAVPGITVTDAGLTEPVKMSIAGNGDV